MFFSFTCLRIHFPFTTLFLLKEEEEAALVKEVQSVLFVINCKALSHRPLHLRHYLIKCPCFQLVTSVEVSQMGARAVTPKIFNATTIYSVGRVLLNCLSRQTLNTGFKMS